MGSGKERKEEVHWGLLVDVWGASVLHDESPGARTWFYMPHFWSTQTCSLSTAKTVVRGKVYWIITLTSILFGRDVYSCGGLHELALSDKDRRMFLAYPK